MPFSGRATYSNFTAIAEDVSDIVSMISPRETPLLDILGDSPFPARSVLHEWLEDDLSPNTIVNSSAVSSDTVDTAIGIAASKARRLQVGMILRGPAASGNEYLVISAISGNTITVNRAFGGTTGNSFAAGQSIDVIADASLEGDDVVTDTSGVRSRKQNFLQLFKKDVIVSGTQEAVTQLGGINDEFTYQQQQRIREALRDLEKAVILGILSGNTIGSATARRTMKGLRSFITTNAQSVGATLTESWLGNSLKAAWDQGGTDVDVILAGVNYKRIIDQFNASRKLIPNEDSKFSNLVSEYESTFGVMRVVLSRWMPANEALILSSQRIKVLPLQGRSFQFKEVASQGDARKGMVLGEYTVEVRNEEGLARIF
jgi:hypothetical protein